MPSFWLEMVGYVASATVAVSLMMTSQVRLRVLNLAGALAFTIYGILIRAYPVAALNALIVLVDLWFLVRLLAGRDHLSLLEMPEQDLYFREFLAFHRRDIHRFFPGYGDEPVPENGSTLRFYVLRNMVPAGVFIGTPLPDGTLHVDLDYVLPAFRDFKSGRFIFEENLDLFRSRGFTRLLARTGNDAHCRYLGRVGFTQVSPGEFEKRL